MRTDPERLLLTSGYAQGLGLLSAELHARGGGGGAGAARGGQPLAVEAYGLGRTGR